MRYTAEFRGGDWGDKPWEWCVIDEHAGLFGSAIVFDLTEEAAKMLAEKLNEEEKNVRATTPTLPVRRLSKL